MDLDIKKVLSEAPGSANASTAPTTYYAHQTALLTREMLQPDWAKQVLRIVVPCAGTDRFQWVRTGPVVTLGQLLLILGRHFSASKILHFIARSGLWPSKDERAEAVALPVRHHQQPAHFQLELRARESKGH